MRKVQSGLRAILHKVNTKAVDGYEQIYVVLKALSDQGSIAHTSSYYFYINQVTTKRCNSTIHIFIIMGAIYPAWSDEEGAKMITDNTKRKYCNP